MTIPWEKLVKFENAVQKETYEKVSKWLTEIFGEYVHNHDEEPWFKISMGSTWAIVMVMDWCGDDAIICSRSIVVHDAQVTPPYNFAE